MHTITKYKINRGWRPLNQNTDAELRSLSDLQGQRVKMARASSSLGLSTKGGEKEKHDTNYRFYLSSDILFLNPILPKY